MNHKVLTSHLPNLLRSTNYPPKYQEMAEATRYHRLPENNRPSMDSDSVVDDEERALIGPFDNELASLKEGGKDCKFTWHPTILTRLIALALLSTGLAFLIVSQQQISIAAIVFVYIALARILLILLHHLFSYFIRVKIVRTSTSTSAQPRNLLSKPAQSRIHVVLDLLIALPLVITASVAIPGDGHYWEHKVLQIPGCVLILIAALFQAISALDRGSPRRFTVTSVLSFHSVDSSNDGDDLDTELPRTRGDALRSKNSVPETTMVL